MFRAWDLGLDISSRVFQCHPGTSPRVSWGHWSNKLRGFSWSSPVGRFSLLCPSTLACQAYPCMGLLAQEIKWKWGTPRSWFKRYQWGGSRREEACRGAYRRSRRKLHYLQILKPTKVPPSFSVWKTDSEKEPRATIQNRYFLWPSG